MTDGWTGRSGRVFFFSSVLGRFAGAWLCVQGCTAKQPVSTAQLDKSIKRREDEEEQQCT